VENDVSTEGQSLRKFSPKDHTDGRAVEAHRRRTLVKVLRLAAAIVVSGFLIGALASALGAFLANVDLSAVVDIQKAVGPLGDKVLGPLGTVLLALIYLFHDFLPDRQTVAISAPPSREEPEPRVAAAPKFELKSFAPKTEPETFGVQDAVRSMISREPGGAEYSAERFFITDSTGNRRGVIGASDDGSPMLALLASDGNAGFVVSELQGAPTMGFYDSNGYLRAQLSLEAGTPRLTLRDEDGRERAGLSIHADGSPYFFIADRNQTVRLSFERQAGAKREPTILDRLEDRQELPL
jgi:hypothetical protein